MLCTSEGRILADRVIVADTPEARFKGLLGFRAMPENTVLLLKPCDQVHMFFMRFAIGVLFLDENGVILDKQQLKPWQISRKVAGAKAVAETSPELYGRVQPGETVVVTLPA